MNSFTDVLITAGVGALFTAAGYGLKLLVDFYFLKSPRIYPEVTITGTLTMPPLNGYRRYGYKIIVEFYNHSKNEAYGFEIKNFSVMSDVLKLTAYPKDISKNPINDIAPLRFEMSYEAVLPVIAGKETLDSTGRIDELYKGYFMDISFKNALGNTYRKSINGKMVVKNNERIFHVGW